MGYGYRFLANVAAGASVTQIRQALTNAGWVDSTITLWFGSDTPPTDWPVDDYGWFNAPKWMLTGALQSPPSGRVLVRGQGQYAGASAPAPEIAPQLLGYVDLISVWNYSPLDGPAPKVPQYGCPDGSYTYDATLADCPKQCPGDPAWYPYNWQCAPGPTPPNPTPPQPPPPSSTPPTSGMGTVIMLTIGVSAAAIAAWWLIAKAPRILDARRAELSSPPRGSFRNPRRVVYKGGGVIQAMPETEVVVFKKCSCGREYTKDQWDKLHLVGYQKWEWGEEQELRNCVCGSTMVIVTVEGDPED